MKNIVAGVLSLVLLSGCAPAPTTPTAAAPTTTVPTTTAPVKHKPRIMRGRYYARGEVVTSDGNMWAYSDPERLDGDPVYAVLSDSGTPDDMRDDTVVGIVYDRETAIYDEMEREFSEEFSVYREGNTLHIGVKE